MHELGVNYLCIGHLPAVRLRLINPDRKLIKSGVSDVIDFMEVVGGESAIGEVTSQVPARAHRTMIVVTFICVRIFHC